MEAEMKRVFYHTAQTECLTYFEITGKFDPDQLTSYLRVPPEMVRRIGDKGSDGNPVETASWRFGSCTDYGMDINRQMMATIKPLLVKEDLLRRVKLIYGATLKLYVVPLVRYDEPAPNLSPSLAVMRFCLETGTEMVIDLYIGCPDEMLDG